MAAVKLPNACHAISQGSYISQDFNFSLIYIFVFLHLNNLQFQNPKPLLISRNPFCETYLGTFIYVFHHIFLIEILILNFGFSE